MRKIGLDLPALAPSYAVVRWLTESGSSVHFDSQGQNGDTTELPLNIPFPQYYVLCQQLGLCREQLLQAGVKLPPTEDFDFFSDIVPFLRGKVVCWVLFCSSLINQLCTPQSIWSHAFPSLPSILLSWLVLRVFLLEGCTNVSSAE